MKFAAPLLAGTNNLLRERTGRRSCRAKLAAPHPAGGEDRLCCRHKLLDGRRRRGLGTLMRALWRRERNSAKVFKSTSENPVHDKHSRTSLVARGFKLLASKYAPTEWTSKRPG